MAGTVPREVTRERERRAWELRQKLWTQQRIAEELGISQQAVSAMFRRMDKRFLAKSDELIGAQKAGQTAQLQYIADEALQAWERSKLDAETETIVSGKVHITKDGETIQLPDERQFKRQGQYGDPRLLDQARGALSDIRSLWGLDAPKKTELTGKDGAPLEVKGYLTVSPDDWPDGNGS